MHRSIWLIAALLFLAASSRAGEQTKSLNWLLNQLPPAQLAQCNLSVEDRKLVVNGQLVDEKTLFNLVCKDLNLLIVGAAYSREMAEVVYRQALYDYYVCRDAYLLKDCKRPVLIRPGTKNGG